MSNTQVAGAVSGTAQGFSAGASTGNPYAAAAGAVIGLALGSIAGGQQASAERHANKAKLIERKMSLVAAGLQRRDLVRNYRQQRAESLAASASTGEGGLQSSAPQGALSSLGSQYGFNINYFDNRIRQFLLMQKHIDKAGRYAGRAAFTNSIISSLSSAAGGMGGMGGATGSQISTQSFASGMSNASLASFGGGVQPVSGLYPTGGAVVGGGG